MQNYRVDCVIIGAGIAGLWLLNRLSQQGLTAIILEKAAIGAGQTGLSQGIIHGGLKYSLGGRLTPATRAIAAMPALWQACLRGEGDIDLRAVTCLSEHYDLWSTPGLWNRAKQYIVGRVLASHSESLAAADYPEGLRPAASGSRIYRVQERVLDVPSLLAALAAPYRDRIFAAPSEAVTVTWEQGRVQQIMCHTADCCLLPRHVIFAAGEGNAELVQKLPGAPAMQRRPLHMVAVSDFDAMPLYAHCLGKGTVPRLTITSHRTQTHGILWYLGGQLAETGVAREVPEQIAFAQRELAELLPWVSTQGATWHTFRINRAEVAVDDGRRPESAFAYTSGNATVVWPTKLALTPALSQAVLSTPVLQTMQPEPSAAVATIPLPHATLVNPLEPGIPSEIFYD